MDAMDGLVGDEVAEFELLPPEERGVLEEKYELPVLFSEFRPLSLRPRGVWARDPKTLV
jgi:hypothetical protein